MYQSIVKPIFDFFCAFFGFVLLFPIFLGVTFLLFIANSGNPFFLQLRPGKNGKIFKIIKFKTMNDRKDKEGNLLSDSERLTKVGLFVRKTSLDEIPQLLNVIKGDMSIIGPRPLLPSYLEIYSEFENRRHEVKPGITGWAQVNGRNTISWDEKFEYDVWYVDHISVVLDLKILFMTIKKVLIREGISNNEGHVSMPAFTEYYNEKNKKT
jgi:lipopolysaccharide/colanic/teichoic acid biosynthesis glycosyltransferase